MYSCVGKAEFSASLLQSSVSRDPSETICFPTNGNQEACLKTVITFAVTFGDASVAKLRCFTLK